MVRPELSRVVIEHVYVLIVRIVRDTGVAEDLTVEAGFSACRRGVATRLVARNVAQIERAKAECARATVRLGLGGLFGSATRALPRFVFGACISLLDFGSSYPREHEFKDTGMRRIGMVLGVGLVLAAATVAQTEPPKPAPELKTLDVLVGTWTLEGDMKPGMMGPGGSMKENEKCEWMDGGFYLVCHGEYKSSMGKGTILSVMGYNAEDKTYTYLEFDSSGAFAEAKGSLGGDTWTWMGNYKAGRIAIKSRFTMTITSATSYDFSFEVSQDGTKWTTFMNGKATKAM